MLAKTAEQIKVCEDSGKKVLTTLDEQMIETIDFSSFKVSLAVALDEKGIHLPI